MEFIQNNWIWLLVLLFFVLMHAAGMGCGGHRRPARGKAENDKGEEHGGHGCH